MYIRFSCIGRLKFAAKYGCPVDEVIVTPTFNSFLPLKFLASPKILACPKDSFRTAFSPVVSNRPSLTTSTRYLIPGKSDHLRFVKAFLAKSWNILLQSSTDSRLTPSPRATIPPALLNKLIRRLWVLRRLFTLCL
jgi:hypothetical protein